MKMEQNFREVFKDFEKNPSDKVWTNIEKNIKTDFINQPSLFKTLKFWVGSGVVISVITCVLLLVFNNNDLSSDVKPNILMSDKQADNFNKNQIVEKHNINKISQSDKSDNSTNNNKVDQLATVINIKNTNSTNSNTVDTKDSDVQKAEPKPEIKTVLQSSTIQINNTKSAEIPENKTSSTLASTNLPNAKSNVINISFCENQIICRGDKVKLYVNGGVSYLWSTGERSQSILVSPQESTDYSVIATDESGSKKTALINVEVSNCQALFVPNAFTPNGDGRHDEFKAVGNGIQKFEMIILSRAGKVVFTSNNIDKGWDGSFNGNPVEMGTYVYSIKYIDELNKPHTINGHVNVIR